MKETVAHPQQCPCCQRCQEWMDLFPKMVTELWSQFTQGLISVIEDKVEKAVEKSTRNSCSNCCRSVLHEAKSTASRSLKLHFTGILPDELTTLDYINQEGASLMVEMQDSSGLRVEVGPESSVKIKIFVLDGDFEVEDRDDWTAEEFGKNIAQPRKDKGPLLKGKCETLMKNGVAVVNDIAFTDNSKSVTKNGWFRLGAQVLRGLPKGVEVREAVSKAFQVKERRGKFYRRHKALSLKDSPDCLIHVGRTLGQRLADANIHTVQDFLQLYHTDEKALQDILRLPDNKWSELIKNAESCPVPQKVYTYYDNASGVKLALDCAFNIKAVMFKQKIFKLYTALDDSQKELVNEVRRNAYENKDQLQESHTPINMTPRQAELESPASTPYPDAHASSPITMPAVDPTVSIDRGGQSICSNKPVQTHQGEAEGLPRPNSPGHNVEVDYMMSSYHVHQSMLASSEPQLPVDQTQNLYSQYQSFNTDLFSNTSVYMEYPLCQMTGMCSTIQDLLQNSDVPPEDDQLMFLQGTSGEFRSFCDQVQDYNQPFDSGPMNSSQKRPRHG